MFESVLPKPLPATRVSSYSRPKKEAPLTDRHSILESMQYLLKKKNTNNSDLEASRISIFWCIHQHDQFFRYILQPSTFYHSLAM